VTALHVGELDALGADRLSSVQAAEQTAHPTAVRAGGRVLPQIAVLKSANSLLSIYDLRSTYAMRLSAGDVADECVTQLLRQGDGKVFTKYSEMKLQMKREAPQKLNRAANESAEFWDRRDDELGVFWDSRQESWDSSGTVFARKA